MSTVTIQLPKKEKERLTRLAIQYGLSLKEFSRRILQELSSEIPEESWNEYINPRSLKESFISAIKDYQKGHFHKTL